MSAQPPDLDAQMQEIEWSDDIDMEDVHAVPLPILPQAPTGVATKPALPVQPTARASLELDAVDASDILNCVSIPIPPAVSHQLSLVLGISIPAASAHTGPVERCAMPLLGIPLPDSTSVSTYPSHAMQHTVGIALPIPFPGGFSDPAAGLVQAPLGVAVSLEPTPSHTYPDLHHQVRQGSLTHF